MSFKCKIGIHSWDGCKCTVCGTVRDEGHETSADCGLCSRCGKELGDQHDWSGDCDKCSVCGKTRQDQHSWLKDCEKCSKCGRIRTNMHHIEEGICKVCGHGTLYDEADGNIYRIVKVGNQVLMAENLAKKPEKGNFWAYDDNESNVGKYGYLYDWETAKTMAPKGWHLPSRAEWERLFADLGGENKKVYEQIKTGGESGFESIFGGERYTRGAYNSLKASAHYWSQTQENEKEAWHFKVGAYNETAGVDKADTGYGLSVRLFKN